MTINISLFRPAIFLLLYLTGITFAALPCQRNQMMEGAQASPPIVIAKSPQGYSGKLVEEFSFRIRDFKINHQCGINTLNVAVRFRYSTGIANSAYPDFRLIAKDIESLLNNYPNKTDYWEIVNKNLTMMILSKYPEVSIISTELQVSPTDSVPYLRSSIITRNRFRSRGHVSKQFK